MGNLFSSQRPNYALAQSIPANQLWLKDQTFFIQNENYTLLNRRGNGKFGSVWEARTPRGQYAAVKLFIWQPYQSSSEWLNVRNSFKMETEMLYKVRGDGHVAKVYGFTYIQQPTMCLIAMELGDDSLDKRAQYLHSNSTRSAAHDNDYIPARDRKNIWFQFVDILLTLKRYNIIHSDIKPSNLVFFGPTLKVVDLGIAQKIKAGLNPQAVGGTTGFSAPECIKPGSITIKADIWSAGAILYYLTYGQSPLLYTGQLRPMPGRRHSPLVHDMIRKCLQFDPNRRISHREIANHPYTSSSALV